MEFVIGSVQRYPCRSMDVLWQRFSRTTSGFDFALEAGPSFSSRVGTSCRQDRCRVVLNAALRFRAGQLFRVLLSLAPMSDV